MAKATARPRFGNAIVCEDVRQELRGKLTLVGVFSGDILVGAFPASIKLAFYIETRSVKAGDTVELIGKLGKREIRVRSVIESDAPHSHIIFPSGVAPFEEAGPITLRGSVNGSKSRILVSKKVMKGDVAF